MKFAGFFFHFNCTECFYFNFICFSVYSLLTLSPVSTSNSFQPGVNKVYLVLLSDLELIQQILCASVSVCVSTSRHITCSPGQTLNEVGACGDEQQTRWAETRDPGPGRRSRLAASCQCASPRCAMSRRLCVFVWLAEMVFVRTWDWKDTPTLGFKNTPRILSEGAFTVTKRPADAQIYILHIFESDC